MTSAHDVAAVITGRFTAPISTMKLQKLAFFAQGWSLALIGTPLFDEDFEAWRRGPVCSELYKRHRRAYHVASWEGNPGNLGPAQNLVVDAMLANYGALSGPVLGELTHRPGTPWSIVRSEKGLADDASSKLVIPKELMRAWFRETLLPTPSS